MVLFSGAAPMHILIFANGPLPDLERARRLALAIAQSGATRLLCANGGTRHALALGLTPHVIIGDLDSLATEDRERAAAGGARFLPHPPDKNETDLELALQYALTQNPASICILGALGGRLDQTLANLSLLSDPRLSNVEARLDDGLEEALLCRAHCEVRGRSGDLVSLLPWGEIVHGIYTEGLKWPLHGEALFPHRTRGISNEMTGEVATVRIASGRLLIVHRRQSEAHERFP